MNLSQSYGWYAALAGAFLPQLPLYLAYLVGAIVAFIRWKKHPRVSLYLLVSIIVLLVSQTVITFIQIWLPYYLATVKADAVSYPYYYYGLNVVGNLLRAFAFGLTLLAVFAERSKAFDQPNSLNAD